MAYEMKWLIPDLIFHIRIYGDHNVKEVAELSAEMNDIFNQVTGNPVITMVNIENVRTVPTDVYRLRGSMFDAMKNPKNEMFVVYGGGDSSGISKFVLNMLSGLMKVDIRIVPSRKAAMALIAETHPHLIEAMKEVAIH